MLHRFRDIAFDMSKRRYIQLSFLRLTPVKGGPWDDPGKILHGGQRMARVQNGAETLRKVLTG